MNHYEERFRTVALAHLPTRPIKADKGRKGGSCNRSACQAPGATWFNSSTRAYYCRTCAHMINRANGEELCKEEPNGSLHP